MCPKEIGQILPSFITGAKNNYYMQSLKSHIYTHYPEDIKN